MNCPLDFDILLSCALGELAEGEAEEVRRHTAGCPRCRRAAGKAEELCAALRALPRAEPGARVWAGVREAAEASRGSAASPDRAGRFFSHRLLAGAAAACLVCIAVLRFAFGPGAARRDAGLAVEEMGGTFARGGDVEPFLRDLRAVVAETLRCAEAGDEACWLGVKRRVETRRLLSRAERLSSAENLAAGRRALAADAARLARAIDEWPPSRLAAEGRMLGREIKRADLPGRLEKEGAR